MLLNTIKLAWIVGRAVLAARHPGGRTCNG